ncbi:UV radiation resistance protein/autophagy-related protein 14 [Halteromyces radiatus]|uniref:UV radiation resistance protein/autophagy-related protein 14 n=1 Tax=Halteromyces radiatus TaxID=101107 RepID=UPI00221E55C0|nr:UV radiation resistance protein/autophagy-related protein 14 [Halteromyces radiatus]KAI8088897.1 UV radiation resistance protein/autophagy-related protein 14 [Halteromyces radiatus]
MTARIRQILVKEVVSLFDLKPGVVEDADDDMTTGLDDIRLTSNNSNIDPQQQKKQEYGYPKEELNSAVGYTAQMLDLIVRYLGIKLPFELYRKGIHIYIHSIPHSSLYPNQSKKPLFLEDDKNFRKFLTGVSMLNYDIAYLCYTQGAHIPLSQVANTLQNLMICCNAPSLGL